TGRRFVPVRKPFSFRVPAPTIAAWTSIPPFKCWPAIRMPPSMWRRGAWRWAATSTPVWVAKPTPADWPVWPPRRGPNWSGDLEKRVRGLSRYLFHEMGFRGNTRHYYDPRNSYLNQVIDRRTGLPITLSAVAMAIGRRAGLDVVGVGLPGHFVAKAVDG